jgi:DNA-binding transcriptional ArsR family regulator
MNSTEELTKDEVFEVLSSSRRRQILYHLHRRGGRADLRALARDTATDETDETAETVDNDVVKRFYISLYQTHVPKLEQVGLVEYDGDEKTVTLTDRVEDVARILNEDVEPDRQWAVYYGALAVVGVAIGIAQLLTAISALPSLVFAVSVMSLAAFQYYETTVKRGEYTFLEQLVND